MLNNRYLSLTRLLTLESPASIVCNVLLTSLRTHLKSRLPCYPRARLLTWVAFPFLPFPHSWLLLMYWCWLTSDFLFIIWAGLWEDGRAREGDRVFQGQDWEHTAYYPGRIGELTLAVSGRSLDGISTYKAELDINRLDELKQNRYRYSPDCIVISEIKKLDEIKKETTFTMKDRFNANIITGCLRAYVGYAESFFHTLGKGKPEDQWIIPMVKQTLLKLEGLSKHIHY